LSAHADDRRPGGVAAALGVGWVAVSTSAVVIVLAAPVPPLVIAMGRVAVTALVWTAIALLRAPAAPALRGPSTPPPRGRVVLSGVLLGAHFAAWIAALSLTSVVHGAVLVAVQPLFAGVFGLFVGDRARLGWLAFAVAVGAAGSWLMVSSDGSGSEGATLLGDGLAVVAAAFSALYLVVNRGIGGRVRLPVLLAWVNAIAALAIAAAVPVLGSAWWHPDAALATDGLAILWLGVGPGLVGHGLMNWAARRVPVHIVSIVILLEPLGAALLAWAVLGEFFGPIEAAGAALLILGAWLATKAVARGSA